MSCMALIDIYMYIMTGPGVVTSKKVSHYSIHYDATYAYMFAKDELQSETFFFM